MSEREGGSAGVIAENHRHQFYFRTIDVTGVFVLVAGREEVAVKLIEPIALQDGLPFAIREGNHTIGAGRVSRVIR
jgi:elongation factor Tu